MDKIVTGIIVGGAAASIFGLSRTKKWKRFTQKIMDTWEKCTRAGISIFWKMTLEFLSWFQKKK